MTLLPFIWVNEHTRIHWLAYCIIYWAQTQTLFKVNTTKMLNYICKCALIYPLFIYTYIRTLRQPTCIIGNHYHFVFILILLNAIYKKKKCENGLMSFSIHSLKAIKARRDENMFRPFCSFFLKSNTGTVISMCEHEQPWKKQEHKRLICGNVHPAATRLIMNERLIFGLVQCLTVIVQHQSRIWAFI